MHKLFWLGKNSLHTVLHALNVLISASNCVTSKGNNAYEVCRDLYVTVMIAVELLPHSLYYILYTPFSILHTTFITLTEVSSLVPVNKLTLLLILRCLYDVNTVVMVTDKSSL